VSRGAWALLLCAACGDDAAPVCRADAGIAAELGVVDTSDSHVLLSPMRRNIFLEIFLDPDALTPDLLELELYAGAGAFTGGDVRTGSFGLDGPEQRYDQCGACLLLLVDRDPGTLRPAAYYMPLSGTLRLDAVAGRIAGALEDVTLRHVRIDIDDPDGPGGPAVPSLATTTVDDGCTVHITRAAFDVPFEEDAGP
jgi:hypothetical protein